MLTLLHPDNKESNAKDKIIVTVETLLNRDKNKVQVKTKLQ